MHVTGTCRGTSHVRAAAATACAVLLAACSYQPTIRHPSLAPAGPREAGLDCAGLDRAILKADTVRWVIRDDGARLLTDGEHAAVIAGNVAVLVLTTLAMAPTAPGDFGETKLAAADERVMSLLRLKREHGCPAAPTSDPERTDLALLARLEAIDAGLRTKSVDQRTALDEQTRLLDGLIRAFTPTRAPPVAEDPVAPPAVPVP